MNNSYLLMNSQKQPRHVKPSYARSVRRTISWPAFMDEDAHIRANELKVFDLSKYIQILVKKDTERKVT